MRETKPRKERVYVCLCEHVHALSIATMAPESQFNDKSRLMDDREYFVNIHRSRCGVRLEKRERHYHTIGYLMDAWILLLFFAIAGKSKLYN